MRKLCILALCAISFAACSKSGTTTTPGGGSTTTGGKTYYDVPNWADDTLIGMRNTATNYKDTIFSFTQNGHSYIKYKKIQYQIKAFMLGNRPFVPNDDFYTIDIFDMSGNAVNNVNVQSCSASPIKYYDSTYSKWKTQPQAVMVNTPPFDDSVVGSLYGTMYK